MIAQSEEEVSGIQIDPIIGPEFVFTLKMSDDLIKERNMSLPENVVAGTRYAEDQLLKRLDEFRASNHDENTVLNYYDENEVHPLEINIASLLENASPSSDADHVSFEGIADQMLAIAVEKMGTPRNYGPTYEQLAEQKKTREDQAVLILLMEFSF